MYKMYISYMSRCVLDTGLPAVTYTWSMEDSLSQVSSLLFASPVGLLASTSHDLQLACVLQLNLKGLGRTFAPPSLKPWLLVGKGMDQE